MFRSGFSLIELSVVIVIIALIVAGITAGQGLVHQGQLKKITASAQEINLATNSFRLQYNAFPGDFNNAAAFWPDWKDDLTNCSIWGGASTYLNGNGDNIVSQAGGQEDTNFFRQLALAGFLESFRSRAGYEVGGCRLADGGPGNRHASNPSESAWNAGYVANTIGANLVVDIAGYSHPFINQPVMTAQEAKTIDNKIDDGVGGTGRVLGLTVNCLDSGDYDLSQQGNVCAQRFYFQ